MSKMNYKYLSRNGLVDLCETYDASSENALSNYWYEAEKEAQKDTLELDESGMIVPIIFERQSEFDNIADAVGEISTDVVSVGEAIKNGVEAVKDGFGKLVGSVTDTVTC